MSSSAQFVVGIDLGTSNCAVAFAPVTSADATVSDFRIQQLTRPGQVEPLPLLPSALYLPTATEFSPAALQLPWPDPVAPRVSPPAPSSSLAPLIGAFARQHGSRIPARLVSSAKSWLCHPGVDRTAPILPWGAPADVEKLSPTTASSLLLGHMAAAWNHAHPQARLAEQEVVITVPASFDEVARALTVTAARQAGLEKFTLVEEPQAAFYDFTSRHRADLSDALAGVRLVLVVDVGGGTTDFTFISVGLGEDGPVLKRIAVGEHLMLGGDNMDATLARRAEERLTAAGAKLSATQWTQLTQASRAAKESLLAVTAPERHPIAIAGSGSRLIGSTLSTELTRDEVEQLIIDGFFPHVAPTDEPRRASRTALQELGLPYTQDPAITRHLAAFLQKHAATAQAALHAQPAPSQPSHFPTLPRPDAILLNGGVFNAPRLAHRLVEVVSAWWPEKPRIPLLHHDSLDLAVARGAAAYGLVRRGIGRRIGGGAAQALYIGVTSPATPAKTAATNPSATSPSPQTSRASTGTTAPAAAVCVIPRGHEEGQTLDLTERPFQLTLGRPVQFPLFVTTSDRADAPGAITDVSNPEVFRALPPLHTLLRSSHAAHLAPHTASPGVPPRTIPVHLRATLTELGTLELWCVSNVSDERWRLEFELRTATTRSASAATVTESMPATFGQVRDLVDRVFGPAARTVDPREVKKFGETLEAALGPREGWTVPLLRELWGTLFANAKRRRRSVVHERLFYRFVGFGLRPGFGYPLDEWRCEQTFTLLTENVHFHGETAVWNEFWILWRRISGGLTEEQQQAIWRVLEPHLARRVPANATKNAPRAKGLQPEGLDEMVRLAASLEHLGPSQKITLGTWLATRLSPLASNPAPATGLAPAAWALGRVGARAPIYGSGHRTVPADTAAEWLELLLRRGLDTLDGAPFAAVQLARLTGDRTRDLPVELRERTVDALRAANAPARWLQLITEVVTLSVEDESRALGDTLPLGLKL
jgi:molecular chaperone DnaK (HSP70)